MLSGHSSAVSPSTLVSEESGSCRSSDSRPPGRRQHERYLLVFRAPSLTPAPAPVSAVIGNSRIVCVAACYTHGKCRAQPEPDVERRRPDPVPDEGGDRKSVV